MNKRLCKSRKNRKIEGVCGGIAEYFNIDATIVRFIWLGAILLKGAGFVLYLIAAIVMPVADEESEAAGKDDDINNMKSANINEEEKTTKSSKKKTASKADSDAPHSDEEFDNFFKK